MYFMGLTNRVAPSFNSLLGIPSVPVALAIDSALSCFNTNSLVTGLNLKIPI